MKKYLFLIIMFFFLTACFSNNEIKFEKQKLMELDSYKGLKDAEIVSLDIIKYLESGVHEETIEDKEIILNYLSSIRKMIITSETEMSCEDNTIIYVFHTKDKEKYTIELECGVLVLNNKHYIVE